MKAHVDSRAPRAIGGPLFTPGVNFLLCLTAVALVLVVVRFAFGLGATTAMNDGYPWGLWIAFDVGTGTAFGCGGFALSLLVYIANRGRYHPLVRPALLTSALGYSIAGFSVLLDLGRPWMVWKIPLFVGHWNPNSVLLVVALCIMAYVVVVWIELAPAFLEKARDSGSAGLRRLAERTLPILRKSMLWLIAFSILLTALHQSSLGSILLLSGPRLHPLWNTAMLPLLFLISCVAMGYGAVVLESTLSSRYFGRRPHREMLANLGGLIVPIIGTYLIVRIADLVIRDQMGALLALDGYSVMALVELGMFATAMALLHKREQRRRLGNLFRASMILMAAGTLYRFDTYLLAFQPGNHWTYFPNLIEILITVGLVAGEVAAFILLVRIFPILGPGTPSGAPSQPGESNTTAASTAN